MNKEGFNTLIQTIIEAIEDVKGEDIKVLDLTHIENAFASHIVICSGNSNTQVSAISGAISRKVKTILKERPFSIEGKENASWILMDYVSVIVHIFQKETREFYDIENLWGDKITEITSS